MLYLSALWCQVCGDFTGGHLSVCQQEGSPHKNTGLCDRMPEPSYSNKAKLKVNSRQNFPCCISRDPLVALRKLQISISTDRFGRDVRGRDMCPQAHGFHTTLT